MNSEGRVFFCGFYEMPFLCGLHASGYNAGVYGWNWDSYPIGAFYVMTGYRNLPGSRIPSEIVQECNAAYQAGKSVEQVRNLLADKLEAYWMSRKGARA